MTEFSWIMRIIDDLCKNTDLETYESVFLKYRVQMQEEKAIDKFFALNYEMLDTLTISEMQK